MRYLSALVLAGTMSILSISRPATADTILHQEGTDLSSDPFAPTNLGAFSVGVNVVRGSTNSGDDQDIWYASLGAGLSITSITFSATGVDQGEVAVLDLRDVAVPSNNVVLTELYHLTLVGDASNASVPAILGAYPLIGPAWVRSRSVNGIVGGSFEYEVRITVEGPTGTPVPEPLTVYLVVCAAGLLRLRAGRAAGRA